VVDEVLAVGDIEFQKKCLGKMEGIAAGGRTVLLVSHNMATVSTLCKQAILLVEGQVDCIGPAQQTVSTYLSRSTAGVAFGREWSFEEAPGGKVVRLKGVRITDCQGSGKPYFSTTEPICITIDYWILSNDVPVNMAFWLFDEQGNCICSVGNYQETKLKPIVESGLYRSVCTIPGNLLNSGKHTITVELIKNLLELEKQIPQCVAFETVDDHRTHSGYSKWVGIIKPEFDWESSRLNGLGDT
jgi:lipopolysaccharide transport system ATP-binding protein